MNKLPVYLLFGAFIIFQSCGSTTRIESYPPELKDHNALVQQLRSEYQCEDIQFENFGENDLGDSTLTISVINSKALPFPEAENLNESIPRIAKAVKVQLVQPEEYKLYRVVIINRGWSLHGHFVNSRVIEVSSEDI